jgi:2-iminobutanoate/2-iminopropanoate deaminase
MKRISTDAAPAAVGPYSQAVTSGNFVFCSGQVALHPETGKLVGNTAAEQAERVLENLRAVLEKAGSSTAKVVKATVYLTDMRDYGAVNTVYARYFEEKPARVAVAVAELPLGALVEIDAIAVL